MSWVPAERVLAAVTAQRQALAEQQARIQGFVQYHTTEHQRLVAEQTAAVHELGQAALPRLDAASIAAVAQAVGLVGLPSEDIPGKLEARRAWLVARLTAITHDRRYAQRELLRHPRTGSLTRALAEAQQNRQLAYGVVGICEEHPRFARLMETGWGTTEEGGSWWRYSYWLDRSAAGEIVAKCTGAKGFGEVRDAYLRGKEAVQVFDGEILHLRSEITAGEAIEREYAELWDEHHDLDARGLGHTRSRIVQHLLGTDASVVAERLRATSSPLLLLFLRASGIAAKIAYLEGIQRSNVHEMSHEIAVQHDKLSAVETRTRRRWAPMPYDKFQKLVEDRRPRFDKRWQRFGKIYQTVHVYDRWDRGRYYDQLLWWDLMTRGRYDGSYIPEVATWHRRHPGYRFDPDWKRRKAIYVASVPDEPDDIGDIDDAEDAAAAAAIALEDAGDAGGDTVSTDAS